MFRVWYKSVNADIKISNQQIEYLKDKYEYPVSKKTDFHSTFPNSYGSKASKSKIIIKGLTLLDAALDEQGNTIPGKSTMMIAVDDVDELTAK